MIIPRGGGTGKRSPDARRGTSGKVEMCMKKFLFLACMGLCLLALAGCATDEAPFTAGTYAVDAGLVQRIDIDVRDREIEVLPSEDGQIRIDYFASDKESYEFSVAGGTLTMTDASNKTWADYIGAKPAENVRKITLWAPDAALDALDISTTNEDISVAPLAVNGTVSLSTNGGSLWFDGLDAGTSIALWAKNGDITGAIEGGYDDFAIACEIKKGDCNLPLQKEGGEKQLRVACNNGDVEIEFTRR